MAKNNLTEAEIVARIESEEQSAYGLNDAELSGERTQAIDYYLGKPFGNEQDGRSQVVSTDVADTVESLLPALLKVFVSGDEVVRFDPRSPDDVDASEQETEAVNYLVMDKNPGFNIFYTWFKDALMSKNGYIKVYWEENESVEKEFYAGLTDEEMTMLVQGDEIEVIEHSVYPDEKDAQQRAEAVAQLMQVAMQDTNAAKQLQQIQSQPPKMLHDVRVQTKKNEGSICIDNVAPESIMVSVDTKTVSIQDARFVQHREETTVAELKEQGFDVPDDIASDDYDRLQEEQAARDLYGEQTDRENYDGLDRKVMVKDTYMRVDGELMRYVVVGQTIIHEEEAEIIPFAAITPVIMPHRHVGRSIADLVMDIQLIKSTLQRGQLDGMYLALNPRHFLSDRVNLDDFLVSRPGGAVRVASDNVQTAAMPLITPDVSSIAYPMLEYMDSVKENRTGVTKYNQGMDANALNKTASGISQIMTAAQQRTELIARIFAETGVKELFMLVHRLTRQHSQRELVMRLRNKWVAVDPRQWKTRTDLSVAVGLGTGNKDQMLSHLMTILQAQKEGAVIGLATPKNMYNALTKLTQNAGFKNAEEFWTDPEGQSQQKPPPQPTPDTMVLAKVEIDKANIKAQSDEKIAAERAAVDYQKAIDVANIQAGAKAATDATNDLGKQRQYTMDGIKLMAQHLMAGKNADEVMAVGQMPDVEPEEPEEEQPDPMHMAMLQAIQTMSQAIEHMNKPKQVVRDASGRAVGIQAVN